MSGVSSWNSVVEMPDVLRLTGAMMECSGVWRWMLRPSGGWVCCPDCCLCCCCCCCCCFCRVDWCSPRDVGSPPLTCRGVDAPIMDGEGVRRVGMPIAFIWGVTALLRVEVSPGGMGEPGVSRLASMSSLGRFFRSILVGVGRAVVFPMNDCGLTSVSVLFRLLA